MTFRLTGAQVLRGETLMATAVSVENGKLSSAPGIQIDLTGFLILPGIIDMHGDAFERNILPRARAHFPMCHGLVATDREAAANGITTAWMAQSWSWEGGHRSPGFAEEFLTAVDTYRPRMQTDLRVQIRCETHTTGTLEKLLATLHRHGVDYVVFNNHLDEMLQIALANGPDLAHCAKSVNRAPEHHRAAILDAASQSASVPRYLCSLAAAFDQMGIRYGSHDDPDGEARETYRMIGARICEFPLTRAAAKVANGYGDPVVLGAPNVLRGGSQSGHVSATDLIRAGTCDALVSDYHYPALPQAAFALADTGILSLAQAWALISVNPARIMGLKDRGEIAEGMRADLAIVNTATRSVEATISNGHLTHLTGEAAHRFLARNTDLSIAAE